MQIEEVTSLADPRIADYRNVRDGDLLGRHGLFMAEGRFVVRTLLGASSRFGARSVLATASGLASIRTALEACERPPPVYLAAQDVLNEVVGFNVHRGCLAAGERASEQSQNGFGELLEGALRGQGPIVALEGISNHDNVGGIFRNAAAFGAAGVVMCPVTCDPLYRKAIRVSMGASLCVPFARAASRVELVERISAAGFVTVALTPAADALDISAVRAAIGRGARVAIFLGAEGDGLSEETMRRAQLRARIPISDRVDSLNVAVTAGIAMHSLAVDDAPER